MLKTKRIYDTPAKNDGVRILVDRMWPRGVSKEQARIDVWLKDIAPSDDLRKWFGHDAEKWEEFQKRYAQELENKLPLVVPFIEYLERDHGTVMLVYAAKDENYNNAVALQAMLENR